jgi:hypothetical protein
MSEKKTWDQKKLEERVIEKIGLSQQKLERELRLSQTLCIMKLNSVIIKSLEIIGVKV